MELRQLRHFVAVAEEGNISRAAGRVFLTQPALSRQIKALEEEIGQCLLTRQAHSIRLTPAGEALLQGARGLLAHADSLLEEVRNSSHPVRLRVGYAPSLASDILSLGMELFAARHTGVRVELLDLSTAEMLAGIESGHLHVIITAKPTARKNTLKWTPLARSPWQLALHRSHRLASKNALPPAELGAENLLVFSRTHYPEYWKFVSDWLSAAGVSPRVSCEYDGLESLLAAVASGAGVALVTAKTVNRLPNRITLKPLSPEPPEILISAATKPSANDLAAVSIAFVDCLREATAPPPSPARHTRRASPQI